MEVTILPPLQHVCHRFCDLRKGAEKLTVKICETEDDLYVPMKRRLGPLLYSLDPLRLYLDANRCNYKSYKVNALHIELAL